ncbi:unnamed protein product, partial [Vitis vinifera]|uniref:Protein kinase domain-containing protein n=1 Tax=Vitis vinifera TaxID=29760 RepID=E0CPQ0_VITVI
MDANLNSILPATLKRLVSSYSLILSSTATIMASTPITPWRVVKCCACKAFQYKFHEGKGVYNCFPKTLLFNGYSTPGFQGNVDLKLPKAHIASYQNSVEKFMLDCSRELQKQLPRTYGLLRFMLWFACAIGGVEMICIVSVWCFLRKAHQNPIADPEGYLLVATRFRRFTYTELKRATQGVSEEIARGGGGVVYKGFLSDHRGEDNSSFSRIRGTRGYMASEWVLNLPSTSKVDVFSYGIVVLEMITGKNPATEIQAVDGVRREHQRLVEWVRGKMNGETTRASYEWIEEIVDPVMKSKI